MLLLIVTTTTLDHCCSINATQLDVTCTMHIIYHHQRKLDCSIGTYCDHQRHLLRHHRHHHFQTDEIVTEGSRKVPCFDGPPEKAPSGFYSPPWSSLDSLSCHNDHRHRKTTEHSQQAILPWRCLHLRPDSVHLLGEVGGPQWRHHLLRQHRLCHAHSLPGETQYFYNSSVQILVNHSILDTTHENQKLPNHDNSLQCVTMEGWINILYWVSNQEIWAFATNQNIIAHLQLIRLTTPWEASSTGSILSLSL